MTATTTEVRPLTMQVRELDEDAHAFTGLAVPWNTQVELWPGFYEQFARGSIEPRDGVKVFWRHGEVIGLVTAFADTDAGWEITGRISATALGNEAYTLLRDGVIDRLSIGFEPLEWTYDAENELTTHTRARVHEVSLVPIPAYEAAVITQVRNAHPSKETPMTAPATDAPPAVTSEDVEQQLGELERRLSVRLTETLAGAGEPVHVDQRSAGQLLHDAIRSGDKSALEALTAGHRAAFDTRSYAQTATMVGEQREASVVADQGSAARPAWVGDLTRIVDEAAGVRALFSEGALPDSGMSIEYAELLSNTHVIAEQVNELDPLTYGKVTLTTKTAPVKTYGGYTELSRQAIERSSVPLLDHNLRAQAIGAGKYLNAAFRAALAAVVTSQRTAGNVVDVPADDAGYVDWLSAIVDAAEKYEGMGLSLDGLVVDKAAFKSLAALQGNDGRPLLTVSGSGTNVVGNLDVRTLRGDLAGVTVHLNAKQGTAGQAFFNRQAIRTYRSALVRLQDDNIINLSRAFSVYGYVAFAPEIPGAIVPVRRTAGA